MIGYLDTSAFVPLLVAEPSSAACRSFWDAGDDVVTCRLTYLETAAALAAAARGERLTAAQHAGALALLEQLWAEIDVVEVDDVLTRRAGVLAARLALPGYDAVHCAAAEQIVSADLVAATGDTRLRAAWSGLGVATYDPSGLT